MPDDTRPYNIIDKLCQPLHSTWVNRDGPGDEDFKVQVHAPGQIFLPFCLRPPPLLVIYVRNIDMLCNYTEGLNQLGCFPVSISKAKVNLHLRFNSGRTGRLNTAT